MSEGSSKPRRLSLEEVERGYGDEEGRLYRSGRFGAGSLRPFINLVMVCGMAIDDPEVWERPSRFRPGEVSRMSRFWLWVGPTARRAGAKDTARVEVRSFGRAAGWVGRRVRARDQIHVQGRLVSRSFVSRLTGKRLQSLYLHGEKFCFVQPQWFGSERRVGEYQLVRMSHIERIVVAQKDWGASCIDEATRRILEEEGEWNDLAPRSVWGSEETVEGEDPERGPGDW